MNITVLAIPWVVSASDLRRWSRKLSQYGLLLSLMLIPILWHIRTTLPDEQLQGLWVQYLYSHVPCAFTALGLYTVMTGLSLSYCLWPIKFTYLFIESCILPTLFCSLCTLISGSLWGAQTWGTYWVWDARLTSFLVLSAFLGLLHLCTRVPRSGSKSFRKMMCILIVIGFFDVILTHFAVLWFKTLHQGPALFRRGGSSIDPVFAWPLIGHILHIFLLTFSLAMGHFSTKLSVRPPTLKTATLGSIYAT